MGILTKIDELTSDHVNGIIDLFADQGESRTYEDIEYIVVNSYAFIVIVSDTNEVIAFGRAISDGRFVFTLYDVIVKAKYRNNGYGSIIIRYLLDLAKYLNIKKIETHCHEDNIEFLKKLDFSVGDLLIMRKTD